MKSMTTDDMAITSTDERYHYPRIYVPTRTWITSAHDGHRMAHQTGQDIDSELGVDETVLKRYDALHYWFDVDADGGDKEREYTHPTEVMAASLAKQLRTDNIFNLYEGAPPKWVRVRDNATFVFGKNTGDKDIFLKTLKAELNDDFIVLSCNDIKRSAHAHCHYSTAFDFKELDKKADRLVENKLCELMTVREALDYMSADLSDIITIKGVSERKWFWESKWLTDYVLEEFPIFRKNFHTILVVGASHSIQAGDFHQTKIYRVLARMGRVNTKVVFLD